MVLVNWLGCLHTSEEQLYHSDNSHSGYNHDWQHIAWVWNGTVSKMYCDGKYVGTLTHGNVIGATGSYHCI